MASNGRPRRNEEEIAITVFWRPIYGFLKMPETKCGGCAPEWGGPLIAAVTLPVEVQADEIDDGQIEDVVRRPVAVYVGL